MISALILTKNEAQTITAALQSLAWCDDVVVVDADSNDGTAALATQHGARVVQPPAWGLRAPFGGHEGRYRNWAIHRLPYRHAWVLVLDADERVEATAVRAMKEAVGSDGPAVAYQIQRRDFFQGTWLRHVQTTPRYIRLFRPDCVRYRRRIHPVLEVHGCIGQLDGFLDHEPFSKGIGDWVIRHNTYSSLEAEEILSSHTRANGRSSAWSDLTGALGSAALQQRRVHQKRLFYRLPARPLLKFLLLYGAKGGFLDGRAGFTYSLLSAFYEFLIVIKVREGRCGC